MPDTDERLRHLVQRRLEPGEETIAWTRVWLSRAGRFPILSARYRDFAVATDRRLMLYEAGWFTRRPRRRVFVDRYDELTVKDVGKRAGERLRIESPRHAALLLEFGNEPRAAVVAVTIARRSEDARALTEAAARGERPPVPDLVALMEAKDPT